MIVEMNVPSPGESISEVEIATWLVADGDYVEQDQEICEIDSDKATLTLAAEKSGAISIKVQEGETVAIGDVACTIDTSVEGTPSPSVSNTGVSETASSSNNISGSKFENCLIVLKLYFDIFSRFASKFIKPSLFNC